MGNKNISGKEVLATPMQENDADAETIREYLVMLAHHCWNLGESFNGKRPFGNSGWEHEVYTALALAGVVDAKIYEIDGYTEVDYVDEKHANKLIEKAFQVLYDPG